MQLRPNLSELAADRLRAHVTSGALSPGERINEVQLSRTLGLSRTPLREALRVMASEGFLDQSPRRGYFVRPLTPRELEDLYAMRQLLDPAALRAGGVPPASELDALEALNCEIEAASDPAQVIGLDDQWHLRLLAGCRNAVLLGEVRRFMALTRRYEMAYFRARVHVGVAVEEHRAILDHLARSDLEAACEALRRNMTSAVDPLKAWLEAGAS